MKFSPFDPANVKIIYENLVKSYEASKKQFWNDTVVVEELLQKYPDSIKSLPPRKKEAIRQLFAIIYYGEIVALEVSMQLGLQAETLDEKKVLAAQVIEEMKHVTAFQRYLQELGGIPKANPFTRLILEHLRRTNDPIIKLVGMNYIVENIAHWLFVNIQKSVDEPVLKELLKYVDMDEAKHVGIARKVLPRKLKTLSAYRVAKLATVQSLWLLDLLAIAKIMEPHAKEIGIDMQDAIKAILKDLRKMGKEVKMHPLAAMPFYVNKKLVELLFPE